MQKTLPLYRGPSVIGSAVLTYENGVLHAAAKTYATISGICRAYIKGASGNLLIGVLSPSGSAFLAERSFSKSSLAESGINPDDISYAYVLFKSEVTEEKWEMADAFTEILQHNKIAASLIKASGVLIDNKTSPKKIAVPLFTGRPFPRPDVLCLMTPIRISGEIFGVVGIDNDGNLRRVHL